jgi:hypothetical protein
MPVNMFNPLTNNLVEVMDSNTKKGRFSPSKKKENTVAIHHLTATWMATN